LATELLDELVSKLAAWEVAGYVSIAAVAIGVIGETIHEFTSWFRKVLWWRDEGGKASALLLIAALAAELLILVKVNSTSGLIIAFLDEQRVQTEKDVLVERRLTARERLRLERLERIILPRSIDSAPQLVEALKAGGFQPMNIAIVLQRESSEYGFSLMSVLKDAGLLGGVAWLPKDSRAPSLLVVAVDDDGPRIADLLWQKFQIGQGWRAKIERGTDPTKSDSSLAGVPTDRNCLVVGSNSEAAFQGSPGQPGEGVDEHGRPVPAPQ
jgi:hypothetical protein